MYKHDFKKYFGQNFLKKELIAKRIVDSIKSDSNVIIEIGPGDGKLTEILLKSGKEIYSVEVDDKLYPYLEARFSEYKNFHLVKSDILAVDVENLFSDKNYSMIGSLPYNISKKIISKFIRETKKPLEMVFLIQKEVAQDYSAKIPKACFLSNYVSIYGDCEYLFTIDKKEFHPEPKVDGGVIRIELNKNITTDQEKFVRFIKNGFINPRKTLSNNLSSVFHIDKAMLEEFFTKNGLQITARPAEISIELWGEIYGLVIPKL